MWLSEDVFITTGCFGDTPCWLITLFLEVDWIQHGCPYHCLKRCSDKICSNIHDIITDTTTHPSIVQCWLASGKCACAFSRELQSQQTANHNKMQYSQTGITRYLDLHKHEPHAPHPATTMARKESSINCNLPKLRSHTLQSPETTILRHYNLQTLQSSDTAISSCNLQALQSPCTAISKRCNLPGS